MKRKTKEPEIPALTTTILCLEDPFMFSMCTKTLDLDQALDKARKALPLLSKPYLIRVNELNGKTIFRKDLVV